MASPIRAPLRTRTPRRLAIGPGQPLSVQEFPRRLKTATLPLPSPTSSEAPQNDTFTSCHLTVQAFLHGLRRPVNLPGKPAEAAEAPKLQPIASIGLEDLPYIDSAATVLGPDLLDPPESSPNEIDSDQVYSRSPEARRPRYLDPRCADEQDVAMKIPKVTRTYTKKAKRGPSMLKDNSAISQIQFSTHEGVLLDGLLDDGSRTRTPIEQLASLSIPEIGLAEKHTSEIPWKRKRQPPQDDEVIRGESLGEDAGDIVLREKTKKTKRKNRRVPVNELALVTRLQSREISPVNAQVRTSFRQHVIWVSNRQFAWYIADSSNQKSCCSDIDLLNVNLDEQGLPATTSPICEGRDRESMRANVGKPVTRIRHEITMPKWEVLAREGLKVPPTTPRATKPRQWRLGSGFDGITLAPSTNKRPQTSCNRKAGHARTPGSLGRTLPQLELSNSSSLNR